MKLGDYTYDEFGGLIINSYQSSDPTLPDYLPPDAGAVSYGGAAPAGTPATVTVAQPAGVAATDWVALLTQAIPAVAAGLNTYQLSQVNLARAQAGLPALNLASYGPQVGMQFSPQTTSLLTYGLIGIAVVMMLKKSGNRAPVRR